MIEPFRITFLEEKDLSIFTGYLSNEEWTPDPAGRYNKIPKWSNYLYQDTDGYREHGSLHEYCSKKYCPEHYISFSQEILKKYFDLEISTDRLHSQVWDGAFGTGWHTDDDGTDYRGDRFALLIYHVPRVLDQGDGMSLHFSHVGVNKPFCSIIPESGMAILINVDKHRFEHKVDGQLTFGKSRFTLLTGVLRDDF